LKCEKVTDTDDNVNKGHNMSLTLIQLGPDY